jgi:hypothetical protein
LTVGLIAQASEQDDGWYWQKYIPESIDGYALSAEEAASLIVRFLKLTEAPTGWEETLQKSGWPRQVKAQVTPEQVRDALLKDPDLLWRVGELLLDSFVMGPWMPDAKNEWSRRSLNRDKVAAIHQSGSEYSWFVSLGDAPHSLNTASSLNEAKAAADQNLRERGISLVSFDAPKEKA